MNSSVDLVTLALPCDDAMLLLDISTILRQLESMSGLSWSDRMRKGRDMSVEDTPKPTQIPKRSAQTSRHFGGTAGEEGSYDPTTSKDLADHHGYAWEEGAQGERGAAPLRDQDISLLREVLEEGKAVFWDSARSKGKRLMGGVERSRAPRIASLSDEYLRRRFRLVIPDVLTELSRAYVRREVESFAVTDVRVGVKKTMASLVDFTTKMVHGMKCHLCKVEKKARLAGSEADFTGVNTSVRLHGLGAACSSAVHLAGSVQGNVNFRLWQVTEIGSLGSYNIYEDTEADQRIEAHHDLPTLKVTLSLVPLDDTHVGFQLANAAESGLSESPTTSRSASRRVGSSSVDTRVAERASRSGLARAYSELSGQHEKVAGSPFVGDGKGLPEGVCELPDGASTSATPLRVVATAVSRPERKDPSHFKPPPGGSLFDRLTEK
jgi:hypothetical protein